jgi:hypothetical protein
MNFVRLASLSSVILATGIGCAQEDTDGKGSGGSSGMSGSAGTGATGGSSASGGSSGSATNGGTGGSTGGSSGSSTGGSSGTATGGGAGAGSAGMAAGGAGAAGMAAGGAGAAGMATGGMGGSGAIDVDTFFSPNLNGLYYELRTYNDMDPGDSMYLLTEASGDACPTGADWKTSGIDRSKMFTAKGTAGQKYTVDFQVRGAMTARCVSGGTPSAMMADAMGTKNNLFYAGGTQFMDSPLNTWQFDVTPAVMGEAANTYFLNGIPSSSNQCDSKVVYDVGYTAKIVVAGDSTLNLSSHASDCKVPENCGPDPSNCMPRTINMDGVEVHASPMQPVADILSDTVTFYPQWVVIDITSITQN